MDLLNSHRMGHMHAPAPRRQRSFNFIITETQVFLTVVSNLHAHKDLSHVLGGGCSQVKPCSLQAGTRGSKQDLSDSEGSLRWQWSLQAPAHLSQFSTFHR